MKFLSVAAALTIIFSNIGCSTTRAELAREKIGPLKRFAVVSFEIIQDQPPGYKNGRPSLGLLKPFSERIAGQSLGKDTYHALRTRLEKSLHLQILNLRSVRDNHYYSIVYREKNLNENPVTVVRDGVEVISIPGIFDGGTFKSLTSRERRNLAAYLGVEGFIEFIAFQNVHQSVDTSSSSGAIRLRYTTHSKVKLYGKQGDEPIYILQSSEKYVNSLGESDPDRSAEEQLGKVAKDSVKESIDQLLKSRL